MLTYGLMAVFVGLVIGAFAMTRTVQANPDSVVPLWYGRPKVIPIGGIILRALSVGLALFGTVLVWPGLGVASIFFPIVVIGVPIIINVQHNRRVESGRSR
ncbi:hypothetical protein ACL9RL_04090 [Plantibacter sp. Mn2098]|uniref:hypothetical protein n=1 Tax=Plantibacter sp. Mn2098 TaxID=3395266 RepID=UPI003BC3142F